MADTDHKPAKIYIELIPNRLANTLILIINRVCFEITIIHSDRWTAYQGLLYSVLFTHQTNNHFINFVDPESDAHTQLIESNWNKMKLQIKTLMGCYGWFLVFIFTTIYVEKKLLFK